jgi:hypothetical protein
MVRTISPVREQAIGDLGPVEEPIRHLLYSLAAEADRYEAEAVKYREHGPSLDAAVNFALAERFGAMAEAAASLFDSAIAALGETGPVR